MIFLPLLLVLFLVPKWEGSTAFVIRQHQHSSSSLTSSSPARRTIASNVRGTTFTTTATTSTPPPLSTALHFFPRKKEGETAAEIIKDDFTEESSSDDDDKSSEEEEGGGGGFLAPFFARRFGNSNKEDVGAAPVRSSSEGDTATSPPSSPPRSASTSSTAATTTAATTAAAPTTTRTPEQEAQRWRAEAERMRLEAERMDAELTLQKISRLEQQLAASKRKLKPEELEALQTQMQTLQTKLTSSATTTTQTMDERNKSGGPTSSTNRTSSSSSSSSSSTSSSSSMQIVTGGELESVLERQRQMWSDEINETSELLEIFPGFIKKMVAAAVDYDYGENAETINVTDLALNLQGLAVTRKKDPPVFSAQQVANREQQLRINPKNEALEDLEPYLDKEERGNLTLMALLSLEYEYYFDDDDMSEEKITERLKNSFDKIASDEPWLVEVLNKTAADATIESLYPKCMREHGPEPTEAQVQQLIGELKTNALFAATQQPQKVLGGYVVRGQSKKTSGEELVQAIDSLLERKPALQQSLSVFYTQDFGIFLDPDAFEIYDPEDVPPILYVTGPNVVRPPRRVQLSVVSAAGLATSWYLAIYPFLLNPVLSKRVEEQLAIGEAGMTPELDWLAQLSLPLFFVFVGLQLVGELGHQSIAAANKVKMSVPTFVPSLITGITSTVTTFKTPPPNKTAMFDIAAAGPVLSMLASLLAIAVGSALTLTTDASLLPALPLEILRQSTLGGGVINSILGNGALSIPEGAQGSAAVASITIPLHPVAVAGYISLIVNALSLLPIGTTDGGRMALAIFGRGAKLLVGNIFLIALLVVGLLGSDLFLFYFGFISLFQTGNEIAAKNEVDKVEFSRVIVAIVAYVLMVLTLTPFQ